MLHKRQIKRLVGGQRSDLFGGVSRNNAAPGFGAGQRHFYFDVTFDEGLIGKHSAHFGGAEHIAKQGGVKNGAGHERGPDYVFIDRTYYICPYIILTPALIHCQLA